MGTSVTTGTDSDARSTSKPTSPTTEKDTPTEPGPQIYQDDVKPISRPRLTLLYICLCVGMFLSLLDSSIVATALFTIGEEFNALTRVTWVALAYTLTYLGFSVPFAALADVIGRRNAYLLAYIIFFAFSLGCGWAPNLNALIAFRAMQGIGGAGLYSITMVIFPEITRPERSSVIGALAGLVVAVAGIVGPVLGGVFTSYATWRWVFWLNGPIALPAIIIFAFAWPKPEQLRAVQKRRSWRELDVLGSLLLMAASILVVYAFQEAGIDTASWGRETFLAPLLVGLLCWALLFAWQWYVARYRGDRLVAVLPWGLLQRRVFVCNALYTLLMGYPFLGLLYAVPIRFQIVNGSSALLAGVRLLPMLGGAAVGSTAAGALNSTVNRVTGVFVAASTLLTLGSALLTTVSDAVDIEPKIYGFELLVGLGFGMAVANASICTALETSLRQAAVAQGIVAQGRIFGGSLGIAANTAIIGVTQRRELAGRVAPADLTHLQTARLSPAQFRAVQLSYAHAFRTGVTVAAAIAGATLLLGLGTFRRERMDVVQRRRQLVEEEQARARREGALPAERRTGESA